jgi:O-antigen ligase
MVPCFGALMSEIASVLQRPPVLRTIASWPQSWFWLLCADLYPVLSAAALPWSTTAVAGFMSIWFIVLLPTINHRSFFSSLKNPAGFLPIVFFGLAILGMCWADDSWTVRLDGLKPVAKLLAIPFLFYHFRRSQRGHWALIAFLASCSVLLAVSFLAFFAPDLKIEATRFPGVPVRNYIDQSQEFAICIFALLVIVLTLIEKRRTALAIFCGGIALGFYLNMGFVALARTTVLYVPVLVILFAAKYFTRNRAILVCLIGFVATAAVGFTSPYLNTRVNFIIRDYRLNRDSPEVATSDGERLMYWRTSIRSIVEAPLLGHGTGSTKEIFQRLAEGKAGEWGNVIRNPHNQTLYVAIQWGLLGTIVLFAMWYFHFSLFPGPTLISWIGLIVVVQNVISCLVNSHLFDFHEGWLYVLGVGIAGGLQLGSSDPPPETQSLVV